MTVLWNKEIEEINKTGYLEKDLSVTDALIENFYNEILAEEEKELLKLAFSTNPEQSNLDRLLKSWDIEKKDASKSLMLAYIIKRHPNLQVTPYEGPRLKGLLNFSRFKNLKTIAHYTKIGKALNKYDIEPLILKGGAMKYLRPELPRIMSDIDILVPEKVFMKCADIVSSLGYDYEKIDIHSIDFHEKGSQEGTVDLHKFIYMETGSERNLNAGLFQRARFETVFGVKSLIPSEEDMVFILLVNLAKNLRHKTSQAGLLYTLFDCKFFLENKPDFDWKIVIENARKTKTEVQMNFAIKFINKISPDILPQTILFEKETNDYSNMVMFNRFYLEDIRTKCRSMKIGKVIRDPKMWGEYLVLKPKYQILKCLKKHPQLIKFFIKDLRKGK